MQPINDIMRHFENIKAGLTIALQRGAFSDLETAVAMKNSLDAIKNYLSESQPKSNHVEEKNNVYQPLQP